jgi:hypothetical protein
MTHGTSTRTCHHHQAKGPPNLNLVRDEVPRVYFPMRSGNKVTLYHDAHQTPGPVKDIVLANGRPFQEASCWWVHFIFGGASLSPAGRQLARYQQSDL